MALTVSIDESSGLQQNDVLPSPRPAPLSTALTDLMGAVQPLETALSATAQTLSVTNVQDIGFRASAYAGGLDSGLTTDDGRKIFLFSYFDPLNPTQVKDNNVLVGRVGKADGTADGSGQVALVLYMDSLGTGSDTSSDAGATSVQLWLAQFQPIHHPDATNPNDSVSIDPSKLIADVNSLLTFDATNAPSGQNVFLMIGDGTPAAGEIGLVVTSTDPLNQSGGGVNSSQGSGGMTLGVGSQQIETGRGLYISFVKLDQTGASNYTVPNLSGPEAADPSHIDFDSYYGADPSAQVKSASFDTAQMQPNNGGATLEVKAIKETDNSETGTAYIPGLTDNDETTITITKVTITRTVKVGNTTETKTLSFTADANNASFGFTIIPASDATGKVGVDFEASGALKIIGTRQGDHIVYETASGHNRVLITNVGDPTNADLNGRFDVGNFNLNSGGLTPLPIDGVTIYDDGPSASQGSVTGTVDEDGLPGGIPGGVGDVAGEAVTATGSVTTLFNGGTDGVGSYGLSTVTSGLPTLTSGGTTVLYSVSGNTLTATAGQGGATVFTFALNGTTGAYTFTLAGPLDHPTLNGQAGDDTENDLTIDLSSILQVFDKDGDKATAAANALVITVDDDTPTASQGQSTGTVDEDGLPNGIAGGVGDVAGEALTATGSVTTLFNGGADGVGSYSLSTVTSGLPTLTSGGTTVVYSVSGNTLTATAGAGGATVFTFALNGTTGAYTFTLAKPLDHSPGNDENDITIDLSSILRVTDKDGDTASAAANALVITVDDDTPTASQGQATGTVDEDGLPNGIAGGIGDVAGEALTATGSVTTLFNGGADGVGSYSLSTVTSGLPTLTSGGTTVVYGVSGNTLTATAGAGGATVFTFGLNGTTGAYTFTLAKPLDHPLGNDENDITIDLSSILRVTDKDGDSAAAATGALVITVDDDTPTASQAHVTGTVDEDGLPGGIAGGVGDVAGEALTATGSVTTLFNGGADGVGSYSLSTVTSGLPTLTSGGTTVVYGVSGNTLTATAGAGGATVFTFGLNGTTGAYTFTLAGPLDHPDGNDENDLTIDLSSILRVTDKDGDSAAAATGALVITVDDDSPTASQAHATGTVDEDGLPGGIAGGVGDVAGEAVTATGSVTTLFNGGADGVRNYSLSTVTSGLPTLTSGGTTVVYGVSGNTLTATAGAGGATVFTFGLNGTTGAYTFTLARALDHATLNGQTGDNTENDLTIDLSSILRVTDKDGDTAAAAANALVITVDDDTPVINATSNLVYANSANPPPGTDTGGTGIFSYSIGADKHYAPYSASNSDFSSMSLASGTVGATAITNKTISWASETDSQAVFNFGFTYVSNNPVQGSTTDATGTLTFDKVNHTYTVRLDDEIQSFTIVRTSTAKGFTGYNIDTTPPIDQTPINQQPPVSVAQLVTDFQVQFSGVHSVSGSGAVAITSGGDGAFAPGEVLTAQDSWVSVSGAAVGVAGDTMQNGEVLDMDFFTYNPFGDTSAQPDARASGIYMKFDGIGNEDLVVILKLVDATDSTKTTTRAIIVDSEDIIIKTASTRANNYHPLPNPSNYGVTLDQNDGLVIIEKNDFNFGNENYLIKGAQVMTSTEGLTGSGYNLNGAVGLAGASTGATLLFGNEYNEGSSSNPNEPGEAGTWDGDVVKISDMGFLSSTTPDASLVFNAAVTDNDGDSTATQTLNVSIEGDHVFSGGNDADTDVVLTAVTTVVSGFNAATDSLDFTAAGTAANYSESLANAGTLANYIAAADAALNGTVKYYFGVVNGNGYLAVDTDGVGITAIVQVTGVTDLAYTNIV